MLLQLKLRLFFIERIMVCHAGKPSISIPTRHSLLCSFISFNYVFNNGRSFFFLLFCLAANLTTSTKLFVRWHAPRRGNGLINVRDRVKGVVFKRNYFVCYLVGATKIGARPASLLSVQTENPLEVVVTDENRDTHAQ